MTSPIAKEVANRKPRKGPPLTVFDRLADLCDEILAEIGATDVESCAKYRTDITGFANDFLSFVPCRTIEEVEAEVARQKAENPKDDPRVLWPKQIEILEAIQNHPRVAVRSGHKIGKSLSAAIAALWFYASFEDARVVITATTARQVDGIIWRELRRIKARARRPIPGSMGELARTGLKSEDFREIVGFTAREAEAVAGTSGKNIMYLVDEASGIEPVIFEAIDGNTAGATVARTALFSNPTKTHGEFFDAFHKKSGSYVGIAVSSEETPNAITGRQLIPGLAGREWIERRKQDYGADSPFYKVRVRGDFVLNEEGKIVSLHMIEEGEERWADAEAVGPLHIGVDPAGPADGGDDSGFAVRRGLKVLQVLALNGLSEDAHLVQVLGIIKENRMPREPKPVVIIDRDGPIGLKVARTFQLHLLDNPDDFELALVRSSDKATREPQIYDRVRDELWAAASSWFRSGGAIPEDTRLSKELHAPSWYQVASGHLKATGKDELRKMLEGRSPDRGDAFCLSVWDPVAFRVLPEAPAAAATAQAARKAVQRAEIEEPAAMGLDPYEGEKAWR